MRLPLFRLLIVPAVALAATAAAQDGYQMPPDNIVRIAEAPPTPGISVSPDKAHAVLTHRESLIPLAELSRTELRIAGLRIDPAANAMSRRRMFRGLTLKALDGGAETAVTGLPDPLRGDHLSWAPDGSRFAFTHTGDDGVELWTVNAGSGAATRVTSGVNAIFRNTPFHWLSDSAHLAVRIVDADRGMPPEAPAVPETPVIQETTGRVAPARTYQDLLTSPHDNALFNYYGAARAVVVDLSGGATEIAGPGIIDRFAPSPDANYLLVSTVHEPFSWLVPYSRFPHRIEIRDRSGAVVREVADLPLHEEIPIGRDSAPTGPRSVGWRGGPRRQPRLDRGPRRRRPARRGLGARRAGAALGPLRGRSRGAAPGPAAHERRDLRRRPRGGHHALVDHPRRADLEHSDGGRRRTNAGVRHLLRGPLRRAGNAADHPERAGRPGAAYLGGRIEGVPDRGGRVAGGQPALRGRVGPQDRRDPPPLPVGRRLLRDPAGAPRSGGRAAPHPEGDPDHASQLLRPRPRERQRGERHHRYRPPVSRSSGRGPRTHPLPAQ